jgi:acetyl esterase/lipase
MVSDGQDAFDWCRANLETTLANTVDVDAYVVGGDSAGGCLATLLGGILTPPPRAVLDDQGITDLSDPWFDTHPDPVVPYSGEFTDDEIAAAVAERDPSKAITGAACPNDDNPELETEAEVRASFQSSTVRFGRAERLQLDVRRSICSKSAWVRATVHPEKYATEDEVKAAEREWSSLYRLDNLSTYPPTFFLHGDSDECVPVWQSRKMAAKLREMGVEVGAHYEPGVGHCFNHRFTVSPVRMYTPHGSTLTSEE